MGKRQRDCVRCGAPVGYLDRVLCCRCTRADREAAAKGVCPGCSKARVLDPDTGRCVSCSRACTTCGLPVRRVSDTLCLACRRRARAAAGKALCPRCSRMGNLRPDTGWCGSCSRPGPPPLPPRSCPQCGATTNRLSNGVCNRCWQAHPDRPFTRAATLTAELPETPYWFDGFVAHVASVHCPARAAGLIGQLGLLLADGASTHPQALLERSRRPGRSMGSLGRTLETFFTSHQLALPTDQDQRLAEGRRNRRITASPEQFRPAVARYSESMLAARVRAARAHTRPRSDSTIEGSLAVVRDLALFLTDRGRTDWAQVTRGDVEAFLASRRPGNRPRTRTVIGQFFTWARTNKLILVDPTRGIDAARRRGFTGTTISVDRQRLLFARWTTDPTVHPHEAFVGLLAMLHGASNLEARLLRIADIDHSACTLQLGSRPYRTPLDPPTWAALQRCISHREQWSTSNPHLLVTKQTKGQLRPASMPYLAHVLDPAGVAPKRLRVTRLAELVNTMDPKLVAAAFGMKPAGVLDYLADHVDPGRIPEELANPSTFGAT